MQSIDMFSESARSATLVDTVESWDEAASLSQPPLLVLDEICRFLDSRGLGDGPLRVRRIGEGHSNATFVVERRRFEAVLRRPPRPPYPKHAHNVLREARVQSALAGSAVPVPQILAICEQNDVLGVPFYLMNLLDGHVITSSLPHSLDSGASRLTMIDSLVDSLVALHAVDPEEVGLDHLSRGADFLTRQLQLFDQLWEANRVREIPAMDQAHRWLHDNRPTQHGSTPMHGDYRLGNVMYAADGSGTIAAVLDWELFSIGDPLLDVGYLISTFTEPGDPEGPLLELASVLRGGGFPGRAYVANRYAAKSGRDLDDLRWYVAFAYWRTAIGLEGFYKRSLRGTIDDAFVRDLEVGIPRLAESALATALGGSFI